MLRLGYIPDIQDDRDKLVGARGRPAERGNLQPLVKEVADQGPTNSCVANAACWAVAILGCYRGRPWNPPSRKFLYRNARLALGPWGRGPAGELLDIGTRPRDAMKALAHVGAPEEHLYPLDPEGLRQMSPEERLRELNQKPPWEMRRRAIALGFRYRRAFTLDDIRWSLASGQPVTVAFNVDEAFLDPGGPSLITDISGPIVGGHMLLIVSELENGNFRLLNSHGSGYRMGGFVDVTPELLDEKGRDKWVTC